MKKLSKISMVLGLMVILSACGSQSSKDGALTSTSNQGTSFNPVSSGTGNVYGLPLAPETMAYLTGSSGSKPTFTAIANTSMKMRVKITAMSAVNDTVQTNWTHPYGCMRVKVSVNGIVQQTAILRVDGLTDSNCTNAPTSQILDFTGYMTGSGQPVTVVISDAEYDNCRYSDPSAYGGAQCGMKPLYYSHQASFKVAYQVDGYYME
jgi:hypothetical protein